MDHRRIDVPREQLVASWIFLKAKHRAGIRGLAMDVRRIPERCASMAMFRSEAHDLSFAITVPDSSLVSARYPVEYLARTMAHLYAEFLWRVDARYLADGISDP